MSLATGPPCLSILFQPTLRGSLGRNNDIFACRSITDLPENKELFFFLKGPCFVI